MVRITTNITIVQMIDSNFKNSAKNTSVKSECIENYNLISRNESEITSYNVTVQHRQSSVERLLFDWFQVQ
jgi:hypothetical protein